ncbi:Rdx family protein [bacterium]|jgi:selT/selW/selH-like putative selenoprotein|nr:Rdx family protein [bacterium]
MSEDSSTKSWQQLKEQINSEVSALVDRESRHTIITYCGGCGYEERAAALAAEIGSEVGIRTELYRTTGGVFEVDMGERRIFSKILLGRFPEEGEVVEILKAMLGSAG